VAFAILLAPALAAQTTFFGTGAGAIPDSSDGSCLSSSAKVIQFDVSGLAPVRHAVEIEIEIQHPSVGQLEARLEAPDLFSLIHLFDRVGRIESEGDACGGTDSDLDGRYTFADRGGGIHFWTAADGVATVPPGRYRPTRNATDVAHSPGEETMLTPGFLAMVNPNGTWELRVYDKVPGGVGSVISASLTFTPLSEVAAGGTNVGAIEDGGNPCGTPGIARNVSFVVSGALGNLAAVAIDAELFHPWVGDLNVTLRDPRSVTQTLFSRVGTNGSDCLGYSSDLGGLYTFRDGFATHFWSAAQFTNPIAPGAFRTSEPGPITGVTAQNTELAAHYVTAGLDNPDGTWTLRLRDMFVSQTGSISSATLHVYTPPWLFADGFERGSTGAWIVP